MIQQNTKDNQSVCLMYHRILSARSASWDIWGTGVRRACSHDVTVAINAWHHINQLFTYRRNISNSVAQLDKSILKGVYVDYPTHM